VRPRPGAAAQLKENIMTSRTTRLVPALLAALLAATLATGAAARPMHDGPGACGGEGTGMGQRMGGGPGMGHRMDHEMDHEMGMGMGFGRGFLRGLDLSDAQQDKVFELRHAQAPAERAKRKAAREAMQGLRTLAMSDAYDAKKAKELAQTHAQAMVELAVMRAEFAQKVRALLTPEQRKLADERLAQRAGAGDGPGPGRRPF
jgi:Spy/CpxP family protein refolding chaperone